MGSTTSKSTRRSSSTNQVSNHQPKKSDTEFNQSNMNSSKSKGKQDRNKNVKRTNSRHGCEFFQSCFMPTSPEPRDNDSNYDSSSDNSDTSSIRAIGPNGDNNGNIFYPRNIEQNVRFSRTLSVGRLRDRVLNRPTFHELSEREVVSDENVIISTTSSSYGNRDFEDENMGARETRYTNLLEHRANVLERRRRIRSQVHALQRMGNRFENLSGHERSCILSGQHRTGQCTCRLNNQDSNNTRGSMSRIVLLTEALFEVLGDIRQQSVVSSTRPASVPTPTEVVEALPVKVYGKLSKNLNGEDAQCYICLVEYEDGDEVRVLPCEHEFHRLCIDKWLKEIHRICPLCRGDVCKNGLLHDESSQL